MSTERLAFTGRLAELAMGLSIWRNVAASSLVWERDTSSDGIHWDQYLVVDYTRA